MVFAILLYTLAARIIPRQIWLQKRFKKIIFEMAFYILLFEFTIETMYEHLSF